ncbi:MAG: hypothetical protein KC733_05545 [Candidatus Omnitrophica bacterium]|nr:hypothetical protein [Candidatus Omnitrophota bacterium]
MWLKWFPWRWIVRSAAKRHGFLDPLEIMSRLQNFAQPSEVAAPLELLRAGAVFHARGLINSQAIQHNLDWIWPYWVECQFDPHDDSFVPRAFSFTHINLTQRNWTAVGLPNTLQWPIIDARGLLTPFLDGWSIDAWIIHENAPALLPSKCKHARQQLLLNPNLEVITTTQNDLASITSSVNCCVEKENLQCSLRIKGRSVQKGYLAVVLRPYNPEGISFVHDILQLKDGAGWRINEKAKVLFDQKPQTQYLSTYTHGDVFSFLSGQQAKSNEIINHVKCKVGMASAAAVYPLDENMTREINLHIPLAYDKAYERKKEIYHWNNPLTHSAQLSIPDEKIQFLYDAAIRTLVLHSPHEVYPGPYTYKRFWFRDAAFILYAMTAVGLNERVKRVLDIFPQKQTPMGYFLSQEGEWDSNGEALWILQTYCALTNQKPDARWKHAVIKGANWILRKRLPTKKPSAHAGLFPPGFSAEHLGPNDYYYWDDFWGVAGLKAAGILMGQYNEQKLQKKYNQDADEFMCCIEKSLQYAQDVLGRSAIPAAPYRRMDAGAIGSLVGGYPLTLLPAEDERLIDTINFLFEKCLVHGGFFQDMTHSGINPYLTLHMAQVLLRANDPRFFDLLQTVAKLATSTGQWPEAIHPQTKGGCMGDGQHVWAAAEWVMMIRNCFLREEPGRLILGSGLAMPWLTVGKKLSFGPALTSFGIVRLVVHCEQSQISVDWDAQWYDQAPMIEVCIPGYGMCTAAPGEDRIVLKKKM